MWQLKGTLKLGGMAEHEGRGGGGGRPARMSKILQNLGVCPAKNFFRLVSMHHTRSLAGGGKGRAGQGRPSRRVGKGPRHLVPQNGDLHQEERVAQEDHKLPTPQPTRHQGDPPLPVTFPPGQRHPTTDEENDLRCMERLSLRGPSRRGRALHYFHYTLGTVPLPHSPARLHRLRRRLHGAVRHPHHQRTQQNQVHR